MYNNLKKIKNFQYEKITFICTLVRSNLYDFNQINEKFLLVYLQKLDEMMQRILYIHLLMFISLFFFLINVFCD